MDKLLEMLQANLITPQEYIAATSDDKATSIVGLQAIEARLQSMGLSGPTASQVLGPAAQTVLPSLDQAPQVQGGGVPMPTPTPNAPASITPMLNQPAPLGALPPLLAQITTQNMPQTVDTQLPPVTVDNVLPSLDETSGFGNGRFFPDVVGNLARAADLPSISRQEGESFSGFANRAAEQTSKRAGNLKDEIAIDDDESFISNLADVPAYVAGNIMDVGAFGVNALSAITGLGTTQEQAAQDASIRNDLPPLGADVVDQDQPNIVDDQPLEPFGGSGPDGPTASPTAPTGASPSQVSPLTAAYQQYAAQLDAQAAGLAPPPQLNEREFWLSNMLNINNRGTLQPSSFAQAKWENQLVFDQARIGLENQADQAILQGNIAQAGAQANQAKLVRSFQSDLRSKRNSFVKGDAGDYWFAVNSGDEMGATSAAVRNFSQFNEQGWLDGLQEHENALGLETGTLTAGMTLDEVISSMGGDERVEAQFRSIGVDFDKISDKPVEFKQELSNLLVAKGHINMEDIQRGAQAYPNWARQLRLGDGAGFESFLSPAGKEGLDAISGFNDGSFAKGTPLEAGEPFIKYNNRNAKRSQPISPKLENALSFLPKMGVTMEVTSGGQFSVRELRAQGKAKGLSGQQLNAFIAANRTGTTRHDGGLAADVKFKFNGRTLDMRKKADIPVFQEIVRRGKANGITGFGAGLGYMGPNTMHIGFGNPAVWGKKGLKPPSWLTDAYNS